MVLSIQRWSKDSSGLVQGFSRYEVDQRRHARVDRVTNFGLLESNDPHSAQDTLDAGPGANDEAESFRHN